MAGCAMETGFDPDKYYTLVNDAELAISSDKYEDAVKHYREAFSYTVKPFGKDAYNAALAAAISGNKAIRDEYLQLIIDNSDDLNHLRSQFVNAYVTPEEWNQLIESRMIDYDEELRAEMSEINERDQLFRPDYDNYDDTINHIRIININRILDLTGESGYPSHQELGYQPYLMSQQHDIVLHHTSQRRSRDKTVTDLEPILMKAINEGRFDPERAMLYMKFQNDVEKGTFETMNTWQYRHPALPDSLNEKIWILSMTREEINKANTIRIKWHANTIEDILTKTSFINETIHPFKFSSVNKSIATLTADLSEEEALEQYQAFSSMMQQFKNPGM